MGTRVAGDRPEWLGRGTSLGSPAHPPMPWCLATTPTRGLSIFQHFLCWAFSFARVSLGPPTPCKVAGIPGSEMGSDLPEVTQQVCRRAFGPTARTLPHVHPCLGQRPAARHLGRGEPGSPQTRASPPIQGALLGAWHGEALAEVGAEGMPRMCPCGEGRPPPQAQAPEPGSTGRGNGGSKRKGPRSGGTQGLSWVMPPMPWERVRRVPGWAGPGWRPQEG